MRCLTFSKSERRVGDSRFRFSWGFFSQNSASSKRSERSAPSTPAHPHHAKQYRDCQVQSLDVPPSPDAYISLDSETLPTDSPSFVHSTFQRPELRVFSYAELRVATRNFSRANLLGEGGFGCVFKANIKRVKRNGLSISQEVAVKQLNRKGQQGHKEWLSEVQFLGMVDHRNLVKLVGYCAEDDSRGIQRLLVYEFMPNRSLEDHLFQNGPAVLSWQERLRIMLGSARGLAYLHEEINDMQVIFRDFKTSNVLLDKDFTPKLSDFGLARQGPEVGASHVTTVVVGTWGYAAPEYIQTGHLTSKSDVWSFGVVLLEMLSGRRSLDRNRPKNEQQLLDWVRPYLQGNKKIHTIMDPRLERKYSLIQAERIAALALQCLNKSARTRPLMSAVVEKLQEIVDLPDCFNMDVDVPSVSPSSSVKNMEDTKESGHSKRQRLLFKSVRKLRYGIETRSIWRVWSPKAVQA